LVDNCDYFIPPALTPPLGGPRQIIIIPFGVEKLEWRGYPAVKKIDDMSMPFRQNTDVWRTDRETDRQTDWHLATAESALCI